MADVPSQEQLLQLLETHKGRIADSRTLWKEEGSVPDGQDPKLVEEHFRRRANWQLGLQGVLNSLKSREVGMKHIEKARCDSD
jgi:hypothetical protein